MIQSSRDEDISIYKIILIGESGVGKSNIISRYVYETFNQASNVTIGVEFISKLIQIDGKKVSLQIWDTAGQQRFKSVNKFFYKNASGVLVVFSLGSQQTFNKIPQWLKQVRQEIQQQAILMLIGNKCDLKEQEVSVSQATKFAKQQNMGYIQTSAALNINISKSFQLLLETIVHTFEEKPNKNKKIKQSILLNKTTVKEKRSNNKKCCK